jgi:hypothetical protein
MRLPSTATELMNGAPARVLPSRLSHTAGDIRGCAVLASRNTNNVENSEKQKEPAAERPPATPKARNASGPLEIVIDVVEDLRDLWAKQNERGNHHDCD